MLDGRVSMCTGNVFRHTRRAFVERTDKIAACIKLHSIDTRTCIARGDAAHRSIDIDIDINKWFVEIKRWTARVRARAKSIGETLRPGRRRAAHRRTRTERIGYGRSLPRASRRNHALAAYIRVRYKRNCEPAKRKRSRRRLRHRATRLEATVFAAPIHCQAYNVHFVRGRSSRRRVRGRLKAQSMRRARNVRGRRHTE